MNRYYSLRNFLTIGVWLSGCLFSLPANADVDGLVNNLGAWLQVYDQFDPSHSRDLAADLQNLKVSLGHDCDREGRTRKGIDKNFLSIMTDLIQQKAVRKYSLTDLGELTSCVTQNLSSWEKTCKQQRAPFQAQCFLPLEGEKLVELSQDCKRVFIQLDHLSAGAFNSVSSALEYHPNEAPHWRSLVRRAPHDNGLKVLNKGLNLQEEITHKELPNLMPLVYRRDLISYSPLFDSDYFDARAKHHPAPSFMNEQSLRMSAVGVDALHINDIAHLDLKPENMMVMGVENPLSMDLKVADFDSADRLPIMKNIGFGTPGFLAPEQRLAEIQGDNLQEKTRNTKSMDVFAFSVMTALALGSTEKNFLELGNCQANLVEDSKKALAECEAKEKRKTVCNSFIEQYLIQHKDRCQKVLDDFKQAIRERETNHAHPLSQNLRELLIRGLDTDPSQRPTMTELKGAIFDHTHERFHAIFNDRVRSLGGSEMLDSRKPDFYKALDKKVNETGFAFYSTSEPKTGALRIAMKIEGSAAPIVIKSNPLLNNGEDFRHETKKLKDHYLTDDGRGYQPFNLNSNEAITLKRFSKNEPKFKDERLNHIEKMHPKKVIKITLPNLIYPKYCDRLKIKLKPTLIQCIFGNQVREDLILGEKFDYKIVNAPE